MVKATTFSRRGDHNWIVRELRDARRAAEHLDGSILRPLLISNVTPSGQFIGEAGAVLRHMKDGLVNSERVFRQGNSVIFLQGNGSPNDACAARPIAIDGEMTPICSAVVGNVLMCREMKANSTGKGARVDQPSAYPIEFAVPRAVLQQVMVMDGFNSAIPEAKYIFNHPVFDKDFNWLGEGYHERQKILVCGESFDPAELGPVIHQDAPRELECVLSRLPPSIRTWVEGFDWKSPADVINYIGAALMVPLMPMLVLDGHPGVMVWANKPGIGKTLACQCLAALKDGLEAGTSSVETQAREIENNIASDLNDGRTAIFLDNIKGTVNVPVLEANMTGKEVAIRGFKVQRKVRRPNDLLWLITSNDAKPSDDLLSRCIHVRLHYDGVADDRHFTMTDSELFGFVKNNRAGILAELAGMVTRWLDAGRPPAPAPCRFNVFGKVIGSVLAANGLPGFLSNAREEVRQHSTTHQQLVAIAERLIDSRDRAFVWEVEGDIEGADDEFKRGPKPAQPRLQKDWVHYLTGAGVITAACSTAEKQKAAASQYLNGVLKVPVEVEVGERTVQAMIVSRPLGGHRVAYALAVKGLPKEDGTDGDGEGGDAGAGAQATAAEGQPLDARAATMTGCADTAALLPPGPETSGGNRDRDGDVGGGRDGGQGEPEAAGEGQEDDLWGPARG